MLGYAFIAVHHSMLRKKTIISYYDRYRRATLHLDDYVSRWLSPVVSDRRLQSLTHRQQFSLTVPEQNGRRIYLYFSNWIALRVAENQTQARHIDTERAIQSICYFVSPRRYEVSLVYVVPPRDYIYLDISTILHIKIATKAVVKSIF